MSRMMMHLVADFTLNSGTVLSTNNITNTGRDTMSESDAPTPLAPPTPPASDKKDVQKYAFLFFGAIIVIMLIAILLAARDIAKPATNVSAPTTVEQVQTTAQQANKYDNYYQHVMNNSGKAQTQLKSNVIELGDLVCGALDGGNSFNDVLNVLSATSSGQSDNEYFASVMYGAVQYICPEYFTALKAYLGINN